MAVDALRSRWAYSPLLMAITMLMPVLGILSRAQTSLPTSSLAVRIAASFAPGVIGWLFFLLALIPLRRAMTSRPAFVAPTLWIVTAILVGVTAMAIRERIPGAAPSVLLNIALIVLVTIGTMLLLVVGRYRLEAHEDQLVLAQSQNRRLDRAREEQQEESIAQITQLASDIDQALSPEIQRIEEQVAELGGESTSWDVNNVLQDVQHYTASMVRTVSHQLARDTRLQPTSTGEQREAGRLRWRGAGGIWDLLLSSHLTVGVVVIGGIYFYARYAREGCDSSLAPAVGGFMAFGLLVYWISRAEVLRRPPWALMILIGGTVGGFTVLQLMLALNPECVPEYPVGSHIIDVIVSLVVLLALMVLFEAGARSKRTAASLRETNEALVEQSLRIQQSNAITRSRMAQILHGGVQGRLSSVSLAIRLFLDAKAAGEHPSLALLKRRVEFLMAEVQTEIRLLTAAATPARVDIERYLHAAQRQWRGLLAIDFTIDPDTQHALSTSGHASIALQEVIDAAITNAEQHGEATRVWISITREASGDREAFLVSVEDDGLGPSADLTPGMGLNAIGSWGGTWSLTTRPGRGGRLKASIPGH